MTTPTSTRSLLFPSVSSNFLQCSLLVYINAKTGAGFGYLTTNDFSLLFPSSTSSCSLLALLYYFSCFFCKQELALVTSLPMTFYAAYDIVSDIFARNRISKVLVGGFQMKDYIPRNAILINEGSATMDIGRTVFLSHLPRRRFLSNFHELFSI